MMPGQYGLLATGRRVGWLVGYIYIPIIYIYKHVLYIGKKDIDSTALYFYSQS